MIKIGPEPQGALLRRADVFAWLPGLTIEQWRKLRPSLKEHKLPGHQRPFYYTADVRAKIVEPILKELNS